MEAQGENPMRAVLAAEAAKIVVVDGKVVYEEAAARAFLNAVLAAMKSAPLYMEDETFIEEIFGFAGPAFLAECERLLRSIPPADPLSGSHADWLGYVLTSVCHNIETRDIHTLMEKADNVDSRVPIVNRFQMANELEADLMSLAAQGILATDRRVLRPEDIKTLSPMENLAIKLAGGRTLMGGYNFIVKVIRAVEGEKELMDILGTVDKEQIGSDRLKFGAKGANLLEVKKMLDKARESKFKRSFEGVKIPEFDLVGVDVYEKWLAGEDITEDLRRFYKAGEAQMVRSSAVYSEDGEESTGAGIYESVALESDSTFEDFVMAVMRVYESVNSDKAIAYREEYGVGKEQMGIVVQERVEEAILGYVNSTRPGSDDMTYLRFDGDEAPLINYASKLDRRLFVLGSILPDYLAIAESAYVQPDLQRLGARIAADCIDMLFISRVLEKYYGRPVQNEFAIGFGEYVSLLQCRPLPSKMFNRPKVEFPADTEHFFECDAEGVCDMELPLLNALNDNSNREGIVVFNSSEMASVLSGISEACPKSGVVLILNSSNIGHGHIETLALEKGLILLFGGDNTMEDHSGRVKLLTKLEIGENQKFRVVSNGRKGRIYEI